MLKTLKNLIHLIAGLFFIAFLDGFLVLEFSEGFYVLAGLIQLAAIIWLLVIIHTKNIIIHEGDKEN